MATVAAVLENLAEIGIKVKLDNGRDLVLKPSARVTAEVVAEVRAVKPGMVRTLRLHEVGAADRKDPTAWLLGRLRAGIDWLNDASRKLETQRNAGLGAITTDGQTTHIPSTPLNNQFVQGFDLWYLIEECLREVLGYDKCVLGIDGTCGEESVVRCRTCSGGRRCLEPPC